MKKTMMTLAAVAAALGIYAATETVDGITWTYTVANGCASVGGGGSYSTAVPVSTSGEITIPSALGGYPVTCIGRSAFYCCNGLTHVTIPNSVIDIGDFAFYGCSGLTGMAIPDGLTSIRYYAFYNCTSLISITIPDGVTSIGNSAFGGCSSLTNVVIPASVTDIANYAFSGCNDALYDVKTIPGVKLVDGWAVAPTNTSISGDLDLNGVRGIGGGAFRYCSNLRSVVVPDGVTSICGDSFYGCSSLTNVMIPASVTSIGYDAFLNCRNLLYVTIPDRVTSVGSDAFGGSGLRSVTIPASLTNIGFRVFSGCGGLCEIKVDEGNFAFSSKNGLLLSKDGTTLIEGVNGEVSIPYSVTSIGNNAFYGRTSLTHVMIPDSVTNIASSAFYGCSGLTRITIPDSVTTIGSSAFSYCSGLTHVVIPYSVTSIGHEAFANCGKLSEIEVSESNPVYSSKNGLLLSKDGRTLIQGANGSVTIPDSVVSIGEYAFANCRALTQVTIPNSVTAIGYEAFYGCSGLTQVTIPNSVTNIEESAFRDCYELTSVTIGNGITHIGRQAFQGCNNLTVVHVSDLEAWCSIWFGEIWGEYWDYELKKMVVDGQIDVEANPLYYAHNLYLNGKLVTNLELPEDMPYWGACAFAGCSSLRRVTIPDSVKTIGNSAFYECTGLTSLSVPETVISVGEKAFYGCNGLTDVVIGNGVTNIWEDAFRGCGRLTNITIPESVMNIGQNAFSDCGGLMRIVLLGNAPSTYGPVFNSVGMGCRAYVTKASTGWGVEIPGVWQGLPIDYSTFILEDGTLVLATTGEETDATIPNTVTRIGANAFSRCGDLERVTIPDSVEAIAPTAFDGCEKLWAKWFKTLERLSGDGATAGLGNKVLLSVTNVVVHYVTPSVPSESVTVPTTMGIVNIITEVSAGSAVAISSEWATQYPDFANKFGNDFTAAVTMTTSKRDGSGNLMRVWQDYVAGTDPTDEDDVFKASITFDKDGKPIISWTPELTEVEAAKRKYTTYGKVKLTDEWVEVPDGREGDYNFFKVTVQMR